MAEPVTDVEVFPVNYADFFILPVSRKSAKDCKAKCKICSDTYKFSMTSKGNLLKHLQTSHSHALAEWYRSEKRKQSEGEGQSTFNSSGQLTRKRSVQKDFGNQDVILTSLARNLIGCGGLSIHLPEKEWFRKFMNDVEPRFKPVSRVAVGNKLDELYEEEKGRMLLEISNLQFKPAVTLDFWTGRDGRSFMGCTVHYIADKTLKNHVFFFKEVPPPHTSENIRNKFEDQLDLLNVNYFIVVTDNAANMKCAFHMDNAVLEPDSTADLNEIEDHDVDESFDLESWSVNSFHFDGWLGCAAHKLQLVVHMGYKELLGYRRVQAAFHKAKSICTLSRRSSHLNNALSARIPVPNDTRWNSHVRLHEHVLKHFDNINSALISVNQQHLVLSSSDKDNISGVVDIMQLFAEATDLLQAEKNPISCSVIPVIDSLENALLSVHRGTPAINALCEALLNGLQHHFSYLLQSKIHQSATALHPGVKLTFADNNDSRKFFTFPSTIVKEQIRSYLPLPDTESTVPTNTTVATSTTQENCESSSKRRRLLVHSYTSQSKNDTSCVNQVHIELQTYLDSPIVDTQPIAFWLQRPETSLRTLALQLLSVPSSSAPVKRLFSKAGILLNQRRTRLASKRLEQLLFFK